ncbi:MAG: hypothetical protein JSW34_00820 [Candidatus Zixiibacteriota bacterium]|nr:MAG: hypothetical protein JSW34_00820 [candidate division Zixibacteria bacterium]
MTNPPEAPEDTPIYSQVLTALEEKGYRGRIVSIGRLRDISAHIDRHRQAGSLDEEFDRDWLATFDFDVAAKHPDLKSIIIVAVPQPHVRLSFESGQGTITAVIPPTYSDKIDGYVTNVLQDILVRGGFRLSRHRVPLKTVAACSGLAEYGKNNITYVEGMGSYCRLMAFCTDMPCDDYAWQEPREMEACRDCTACLKKCPTNAIADDRFLLRAERCITYHNESEGPFPEWIEPAWHHCLIGCLYCQAYCPVNHGVSRSVKTGPSFDLAETNLILKGVPANSQPEATRLKLEEYGFYESLADLTRNLSVLIEIPGNIERGLSFLPEKQGMGDSHGFR